MDSTLPPLLADVLPDLAVALDRLLRRKGLNDLAGVVPELRIHAVERGIFFVPLATIEHAPPLKHGADDRSKWSYMYHPGRRRHWLGRVPRHRWGLVAEEIDGQLAVLTVSDTAGALRDQLAALQTRLRSVESSS